MDCRHSRVYNAHGCIKMKQRKITIGLLLIGPLLGLLLVVLLTHHPKIVLVPKPSVAGTRKGVISKGSPAQLDSSPAVSSTTSTPRVVTTSADTSEAVVAPKQDAIKKSVTHEYTYRALKAANDPSYSGSWALQKVNAPAAWDITTGNDQTIVAVIDSGFALNHEDLTGSWYQNPSENGFTSSGDRCWTGTPQDKKTNHCDDDNNGYVDDYKGWDFSGINNLPQAGETDPTSTIATHGTEVAGLVGARGNNGKGSATINWNTKIMPLQALNDDGVGYTSDIISAIYYAVDNGAGVINMSLGGYESDPAMSTAINYAYQHKVAVVAAAGNCGAGTESGCSGQAPGAMAYPALNAHVISVGATMQNDQRASFSSYGPSLDVVAPGYGAIVSPAWSAGNPTTGYSTNLYGTSFSTPQVSSLVSLIKSIRPSSSVDDITALLAGSATKLAAMSGQFYVSTYGHGQINAAASVSNAQLLNSANATPVLDQTGGAAAEHNFAASEAFSSGCEVPSGTPCTIKLTNANSGLERYLPYQLASSSGTTGWSWNTSSLTSGAWETRALQGENISLTPYSLLGK